MRAQERASARKQLDKRLNGLRNSDALSRPPRGWIKAIREALGMTTTQFGKRLGVSQPTALGFEKSEVSKGISLETLERAAHALDCRLVYALPSMGWSFLSAGTQIESVPAVFIQQTE